MLKRISDYSKACTYVIYYRCVRFCQMSLICRTERKKTWVLFGIAIMLILIPAVPGANLSLRIFNNSITSSIVRRRKIPITIVESLSNSSQNIVFNTFPNASTETDWFFRFDVQFLHELFSWVSWMCLKFIKIRGIRFTNNSMKNWS